MPPGGCRHGGDPIPERTGGLAHVPETRLPEISHQVLLPHTPQISLPSPERALASPSVVLAQPWTLKPLDLLLCYIPRAKKHEQWAPPTGILVLALSLALHSPLRLYTRHGQPWDSASPVWTGVCPQPGSLQNTPQAYMQPPASGFHSLPAGPRPGISCQQYPGGQSASGPRRSSLAWPSVSPARSTRQVLINHCGGNNGQQKEAPEAFPYLTAALAACLPP